MKYFKPNFYFKKVTPYSEKITLKTKNFTPNKKIFKPNLIFFNKPERLYTKLVALLGFRGNQYNYFFC